MIVYHLFLLTGLQDISMIVYHLFLSTGLHTNTAGWIFLKSEDGSWSNSDPINF